MFEEIISQIIAVELSEGTLLVLALFPFIYFVYHATYWYRPGVVRNLDALFSIVVIFCAVVALVRLAFGINVFTWPEMRLTILHLAPMVLAFLVVLQGKKTAGSMVRRGKPGRAKIAPITKGLQRLSWDELILDEKIIDELKSIVKLLKNPKTAKKYGIDVPKGLLLSGPPGTGKTTVARVIASDANLSFYTLNIDEIFSKWVGESEKNLSDLFQSAIANSPSVIFIDEVDAIGKQRSGGEHWAENALNHLLQLMDGVVKNERVYIIAATNRPELVDPALKRAGRLTREVEIGAPNLPARMKLFRLYLSKLKVADCVDLEGLARITSGKTGADIKEICNQAGLNAFQRESVNGSRRHYVVSTSDLEAALTEFI